MEVLVIGFGICGIGFSLLAILIRLLDRRIRQDIAEILLSIALFAFMWFIFIYLMVITGYIRHLPYLYNKGIPLYYLSAPCLYFYVRLKLYPVPRIPIRWFIHTIPFFVAMVDIVPYMLISQAEMDQFLAEMTHNISMTVRHDFGFIDQEWHYFIKLTLALSYLLAQWRLLLLADAMDYPYKPRQRINLYSFTILFTLFNLIQLAMVLNLLFNPNQVNYILKDYDRLFWGSMIYLLFSIWLCVGPYLLMRQRSAVN